MSEPSCPYEGPLHPRWEPDPEFPDDPLYGGWVFEVSALTALQLGDLLRAHAHGVYSDEAAVELVIAHRHWLHSGEFRSHITAVLGYSNGGYLPMASIAWMPVINALNDGDFYASSSEDGILRTAASLASRDITINLRDAMWSLDGRNAAFVGLAIAHACGERQEWPS